MNFIKTCALILFFAASTPISKAEAKNFKNAYISFDILDSWDCKPQTPEWVCRSNDPIESREAVIIITAKEKGPTDSFPLYEAHMNSSQTVTMKSGTTLISTVVYKAQMSRYNDQPWLDGLQRDSEIKNYFTRYVATVKDDIAILITFSAHNKLYSKYSASFINTIKSLRIIAPKDILNRSEGKHTSESFGTNPQEGIGVMANDPDENPNRDRGNEMVWGMGILALAIVGYVIFRIKSQKS